MWSRKGLRAVVLSVVAAGLSFRATAAFSDELITDTSFLAAEVSTISTPDFNLQAHYSEPSYLASNSVPELLPCLPPQDLFTYHLLEPEWSIAAIKDAKVPAWDSLWNSTVRIPMTAVPEPTTLAFLALGSALLGWRRKHFGGR